MRSLDHVRSSLVSCRLVSHLFTLAFVGCGLFLFALSIAWKSYRPGELIVKERVLAWTSPTEKTFRMLNLDAAQAKFRLENVGGRPVRILDVQTTCGCVTPEISPKTVAPGEVRVVEVKATPIQIGEKSVDITITTDSPVSPKLVLTLRIIGSRRGPYMFEVQGDLNFPVGTTGDDVRFVLVNQVELEKSRPTPPIVKNELKFIQLTGPELELEGPFSAPGMVHRRYVCKARKRMADGDPSQSGRISVVDPWDPDHVEAAHVHCEASVPIRVSPTRAILTVQNGTGGQRPVARFVVSTRESIPDLVIELEGDAIAWLALERKPSKDGKLHHFSLALKGDDGPDGLYSVSVGSPSSPDRIQVPVAVRKEVPR